MMKVYSGSCRCGIFSFVDTRLNPGECRVNPGCIEAVDTFSIPVSVYGGKSI